MAKKGKLVKVKNVACLNCGYPFVGTEVYCPECGQKNKSKRIYFGSFLREVFNGFTSWDAKFWKTLFPLLIRPGKVSKDYIEGKRARYTNPFRFYLTTSIIFFLVLGLGQRYNEFKSLQEGKTISSELIRVNANDEELNRDSIKKHLYEGVINVNVDSLIVSEQQKDSVTVTGTPATLLGLEKLNTFIQFSRKNPVIATDKALDSLQKKKTFSNRFWYSRARLANELVASKEALVKFNQEIISYFSIALFVFLPIFALFLYLFYIRRGKTYVEHLVFTFHTQTVFFILFTVFYIISQFFEVGIVKLVQLFSVLFLVYLFLAMKNFYAQGKLKTLLKFCLANITFLLLLACGVLVMSGVAFALY